jgi:phosphoenolpyruvate carboxykinase (GTP)
MLPFCGYNMADYFAHWLEIGASEELTAPPAIFQVNWFRRGSDGRFLWPGFGDNSRVIEWIIRRVQGEAGAIDSPIGYLPDTSELNLDGLDVPEADLEELFHIDAASWSHEADLTEEFYAQFGDRIPAQLTEQLAALRARLAEA